MLSTLPSTAIGVAIDAWPIVGVLGRERVAYCREWRKYGLSAMWSRRWSSAKKIVFGSTMGIIAL
jgi:hypothetical protein